MTTVVKYNNTLLFLIKINILITWYCFICYRVSIKKTLYEFAIQQMRMHNIVCVLYFYFGVKDAFRLNDNYWSSLTKAMTSGDL